MSEVIFAEQAGLKVIHIPSVAIVIMYTEYVVNSDTIVFSLNGGYAHTSIRKENVLYDTILKAIEQEESQ